MYEYLIGKISCCTNEKDIQKALKKRGLKASQYHGFLEEASEQFSDSQIVVVLEHIPDSERPLHLNNKLINLYLKLECLSKAERLFNFAYPDKFSKEQQKLKLRIYQLKEDYQELIEQGKVYLTNEGKDTVVLNMMANAYEKLGDFNHALQMIKESIKLSSNQPMMVYKEKNLKTLMKEEWISSHQIKELVETYPSSEDLMLRYADQLKYEGEDFSGIKVLKDYYSNTKNPRIALKIAQYYAGSNESVKSEKYFSRVISEDPLNLQLIGPIIEYFINKNNHQIACELFSKLSTHFNHAYYIKLNALLLSSQGQHSDAIKKSIQLVRLKANSDSVIFLCGIYLKAGKLGLLKMFMLNLEKEFQDITLVWEKLIVLNLSIKNYLEAYRFLCKLITKTNLPQRSVFHYLTIAWHLGQGEKAFLLNLAKATLNPKFASSRITIARSALHDFLKDVNQVKGLFDSNSTSKRIEGARLVREITPKRGRFKLYSYKDKQALRVNYLMTKYENEGDHKGFVEEVYPIFEEALIEVNIAEHASGMLYRMSNAYLKCHKVSKSLSYLERALWIEKESIFLLTQYSNTLKRYHDKIISRKSDVGILLVSHQKNIDKTNRVAEEMTKNTDFTVITLCADEASDEYTLQPKSFGYQLTVPCNDGYLGLSHKMALAYRYIYACSKLKGVYKIDDDIVISNYSIFSKHVIECQKDKNGYVGVELKFSNPVSHRGRNTVDESKISKIQHYPCSFCDGGKGYYLSRKNLSYIFEDSLTKILPENGYLYEDIYIGEILNRRQIRPTSRAMHELGAYEADSLDILPLLNLNYDSPKIAITSTVKSDVQTLKKFVHYHLNIGIDHVFLFFDDPLDPVIDEFKQKEHVSYKVCNEEYWKPYRGRPRALDERQEINATECANDIKDQYDWLIHIDVDELIYSQRTLAEAFKESNANVIRFKIMEAVTTELHHVDIFETNLFRNNANKTQIQEAISLGCHQAVFYDKYFRGHTLSKIALNLKSDFTTFRVHYATNKDGQLSEELSDEINLLHFDCIGYQSWYLKWMSRHDGSAPISAMGPNRNLQFESFVAGLKEGEEGLNRRFLELHSIPEQEKSILFDLNMLTTIEINHNLFLGP